MSRDFRAGFIVGVVAMILAVIVIGKVAKVFADTWSVATVRSYHMERRDYEETNIGFGIERSLFGNTKYAIGFYRNSERTDSIYGAAVYCPLHLQYGHWRGCGLAGAVTGYSDAVDPLAGLVLAYEGKTWGWNFLILPNKHGDLSQGVIAAQLKRRF